MQQQYNNQYPQGQPQQPQQPQYQPPQGQPQYQPPQQPQYQQPQGQPQYQPQQPQYQPPQQPQYQPQYQGQPQYQPQYQQPQYRPQPAPKKPTDKKTLFGIITAACFGAAVLFTLIGLIVIMATIGSFRLTAPVFFSSLVAILGLGGFVAAAFIKSYTKFIAFVSSIVLYVGEFGMMVYSIMAVATGNSIFGAGRILWSVGFIVLIAFCWLAYDNNSLVKKLWFVPGAVLLTGLLIIPFAEHYFTSGAVAYSIFDLLAMLSLTGGSVILGLYFTLIHGEKVKGFRIPDPEKRQTKVPQPQQPQQPQQTPYQGQ